ncbi:Retrovirus-related Pol poly, partial [Paramuricea clavata]
HLGINKTYEKIIRHFYWLGILKTVAEFCKTCHTCQVASKPNQVIPKALLKPIPAFEEPFNRIMINCVGPLPKTKRGDRYLLTIMCVSTRFPEAILLRNIKVKTIVQTLTNFFTLAGLPKSTQSDHGSNFMSGLFQQIMHELRIKQYDSSAYHPESQGALERFHQTLKQMIKTYCFETEKDWDDGVHFLLFAARESVQESLGFSFPFELVFGQAVRGPLKLLKEKLLADDGGSLILLQYVSGCRTKLTKACELARNNLQTTQNRMKHSYDKNTVSRNFQNGYKVLALLPFPGNPLQAWYFRPYVIEKRE